MAIRHAENIKKVGEASLTLAGEYHTVEIPITTAGNILKTLKLSESEACLLRDVLDDALSLRPEEGKIDRFNASIRAGRS